MSALGRTRRDELLCAQQPAIPSGARAAAARQKANAAVLRPERRSRQVQRTKQKDRRPGTFYGMQTDSANLAGDGSGLGSSAGAARSIAR